MGDLGSFGAAKAEALGFEPETFTYFGERFRISTQVGSAALFDFAAATSGGTADVTGMAAAAAMKEMMVECLDPDEFERFWRTHRENRASAYDLVAVVNACYEAVSARPTGQPSGSSPGLPQTLTNSSFTPSPIPASGTPAVQTQGQILAAAQTGG